MVPKDALLEVPLHNLTSFTIIEAMPLSLPGDLNSPDASEAEGCPSIKSFLDGFNCPPVGKRDFNLFFRDPMRAKAADTKAKPGAEAY